MHEVLCRAAAGVLDPSKIRSLRPRVGPDVSVSGPSLQTDP